MEKIEETLMLQCLAVWHDSIQMVQGTVVISTSYSWEIRGLRSRNFSLTWGIFLLVAFHIRHVRICSRFDRAAVQDASADGRWTLEAGALVLADQGLAAIDEFDKMNQADRSSMHEAMEQQTISISKAGINASLRTLCVLAAANPKAGRFQPVSEVPFTGQINLAPPLISRFDVIWLLTDEPSEDKDAKIAGHIVDNRLSGTSELLVNEGSRPDPQTQFGDDKTKPYGRTSSQRIHSKVRCLCEANRPSKFG